MTKKQTADIYIRVSTEEQAKQGISLEAQEDTARKYCDYKGFAVAQVLMDTTSGGSTEKRPGIKELIRRVTKKEINHVVFWRLDRPFRDTVDALNFSKLCKKKECGVT